MSSSQSIRDIFFEECEDLVDALVDGLADIVGGDSDPETINAVFRAVHSIKGGAGAFGLDQLVTFAHTFETVLDQVRSNKISPESELNRSLQKAGDILSDLVEAAQNEEEGDEAAVDGMLATLKGYLGEDRNANTGQEEIVDFEPLGLPGELDLPFDLDLVDLEKTIEISFRPTRELHDIGHDPVALFRALATLGSVTVRPELNLLPELESYDSEIPYLSWALTLKTAEKIEKIEEIFEFVEGICDLEISTEGEGNEEMVSAASEAPTPKAQSDTKKRAESSAHNKKSEARNTLRVDVGRVDRLINLVGELIVNQAMISQRFVDHQTSETSDVQSDLEDYKQLARDIQEGVMSLRTQPVKPLFQRMARIVREAADGVGKSVHLETEGEWTEVDKKVTEKLSDPLTHMIRNSVDHGIESPEQRKAAGKPPQGTIRLSASHKSGNVLISIADDGAGLNREKIKKIAEEKNLIQEGANLSESEIDELLFLPGFSTADTVTNLSGRGVGMDVVRNAIEGLGGRISISSTAGEGTTFSIQLPLTLAVLDGMVIELGNQTLIVPISSILEAIRPQTGDLSEVEPGKIVLKNRGVFVPVIQLSKRLDIQARVAKLENQVLLIVSASSALVALAVDEVRDQRQVVIKSLSGNYGRIDGISAATILGDGSVALIVDPDGLTGDQTSV